MIIKFRKHEDRVDERSIDQHAVDEHEWAAQERAFEEARAFERQEVAAMDASRDPGVAAYRQVARALRQPLPDLLPADFAAQVAARAAAQDLGARDASVEQWLVRGLVTVFGLSAVAVAAIYGGQWLQVILQTLRLDTVVALNWALALGACVAVTSLMEPLRRRVALR